MDGLRWLYTFSASRSSRSFCGVCRFNSMSRNAARRASGPAASPPNFSAAAENCLDLSFLWEPPASRRAQPTGFVS
uniref:Uncharacterized protein n=1 Tax=Antheraea pernyi nuclear polyhedrosis virus TaxID=161494 RepID=Q1HH70_NPVAP